MNQEPLEVFSKDTFLTALRHANTSDSSTNGQSTTHRIVIEEPPAMALVREKHAQLHDVVGSLSEKISAVLGRQERDFLAAYRAHMYNVQKELHDMREKMQRNETVENKTEKIKKIEEERDWYRKEALRLDAFTTSMTKDLKYMKEKLESIEEDRNWLEKQLKACKKQNKLLRAELDLRVPGHGFSTETEAVTTSSTLPSVVQESPKNTTIASTSSRKASSRKLLGIDYGDSERPSGLPALLGNEASATPMLLEEREDKYKKQIRGLKKELQQKNRELALFKQQRQLLDAASGAGGSHMEQFFLQCIESVKDEVAHRRSAALDASGSLSSSSSSAPHQRSKALRQSYEKTRNQKYDVGPEFEDFSSADRVRVIERLLAHDEVLTFVYEHLFPSSSSSNAPSVAPPSAFATAPSPSIASPRIHTESSKSLPDATDRVTKPAGGSGAAAVRSHQNASGLPIDDYTRDYLRSMRPQSSSGAGA